MRRRALGAKSHPHMHTKEKLNSPVSATERKQACSSYFIRDASGVRIKNQSQVQRLVQADEKELSETQQLERVKSIRVNGPFALAHVSFQPFAQVALLFRATFVYQGKRSWNKVKEPCIFILEYEIKFHAMETNLFKYIAMGPFKGINPSESLMGCVPFEKTHSDMQPLNVFVDKFLQSG